MVSPPLSSLLAGLPASNSGGGEGRECGRRVDREPPVSPPMGRRRGEALFLSRTLDNK